MKTKIILAVALAVVLVAVGIGVYKYFTLPLSSFGQAQGILSSKIFVQQDFMMATTTNATSTPLIVTGAKKITLVFGAFASTTDYGTAEFSIDVSPITESATDALQTGVTLDNQFLDYNKLIDNVTNSISQNLTRVASKIFTLNGDIPLSASASSTYSMDLEYDAFQRVRCIAVVLASTSENTYATCQALVEY